MDDGQTFDIVVQVTNSDLDPNRVPIRKRIDLADNLCIDILPVDLVQKIFKACEPKGYHFDPVRQFNQMYSFVRKNLPNGIFFLSKTQNTFKPNKRSLIYNEFKKMLTAIYKTIEPPIPTDVTPVYDDSNLVLNIQKAAMEFHKPWEARLKLKHDSRIQPEHWARIKALTRRLGELNMDEYNNLKPVADMLSRFQTHLYLFVDNPISWDPDYAPDEMKQASIDNISQELNSQLHQFFSERLFKEQIKNWHQAYSHRGTGSTKIRAYEVKDIYNDAAPILGEVPNSESSVFVKEIREILKEAVSAGCGKIKGIV